MNLKTWPWRHLIGKGRKPANSARIHRRPYPTIIAGYENAKRRPEFVRTRAAVKGDSVEHCASWNLWRRYWKRWSRKRRAARKRRRGWA